MIMDNVVGRLVYKITGDASLLNASLSDASNGFDTLSKKAMTFGTRVLTGMLIKKLGEAASKLEELDNKFNTVFSGIEKETNTWVEVYAEATSRGVIATKEFLANQQDIQTGFGDNTKHAAEFSKAIVGLTNDLASFANVSIEETQQAVNSVLAGQFEAGRRFGLGLTVDIINMSEYAKAINKTWLEMDNLEKREAIISVALSQSQNAIHQNIDSWEEYNWRLGDAAITADSYANSATDFRQTLEDTAASLGTIVLPTLTTLLKIGTDVLDVIADAPKPIQTLIVAIGALGISLTAISGPVGWVVGSLSALVTIFGSVESSSDKLKKSTDALAVSSSKYQEIVKILEGDTSNLTIAQLALYEAQKKLARSEVLKNLENTSTAYKDNANSIKIAKTALDNNRAAFDAYNKAITDGKEGIEKALTEPYESSKEAQNLYYQTLKAMIIDDGLFKNAEFQVAQYAESVTTFEASYNKLQAEMESTAASLAQSVISGAISIQDLVNVDEALKKAVTDIVNEQQNQKEATDSLNTSTKVSTTFTSDYTTKLRELKAELKEEEGLYVQAATIRLALSKQNKEAAIRELAEKNNLIQEGEDVNNLTISELKKRIKATKEGHDELSALEEYFKQERITINKETLKSVNEAKEKELTAKKEWDEKILEQDQQMREEEAQHYIEADDFEKAYEIRLGILEDQKQAELKALDEQISKKEATEEDKALIEQYYANETIRLNNEKNDAITRADKQALEKAKVEKEKVEAEEQKLADKRKTNADKYSSLLIEQSEAVKEASAEELISLGKITDGYAIKQEILEAERDREVEALKEKVSANEATEEDIANLKEYYANKTIALNEEMNDAIIKANEEAAETEKEKWLDVAEEIVATVQSIYGSLVEISANQTDAQIALIEKQQQAQFEALDIAEESEKEKLQRELKEAQEKGDMETAIEKDKALQRLLIEEENQKQIDKLNYEQAKKEKELAIFNAIINMLAAVIKAFSNPGGWAGVALSGLALATGMAQIAAIQSQPLPSYAVGTTEITEDQIAQVHSGEIIVPKTFSEGIRDGELTLGNGSKTVVNIVVNNSTDSSVTAKAQQNNKGETDVIIAVTKVVNKQIQNGSFDSSLSSRYGLKRSGING